MNKDSVLENNSQIWATIGKIGAFLSVIIALITIYSQLYPDKAEINATCNVVDVLLPPSVLIDLLSEKDKKNLKQIEKGLSKDDMITKGINPNSILKITRLMEINKHKTTTPPIISIGKR